MTNFEVDQFSPDINDQVLEILTSSTLLKRDTDELPTDLWATMFEFVGKGEYDPVRHGIPIGTSVFIMEKVFILNSQASSLDENYYVSEDSVVSWYKLLEGQDTQKSINLLKMDLKTRGSIPFEAQQTSKLLQTAYGLTSKFGNEYDIWRPLKDDDSSSQVKEQ